MGRTVRKAHRDVFVGRQPICDGRLEVRAFELLYRAGHHNSARGAPDGVQASATVALNSILDIGLDRLVGNKLAFLNTTRAFLCEGHYLALPPAAFVLEVLEDIEPDREVLEAVAAARRKGFQIALDDFVYRQGLEPLIEHADFVKVEVPLLDRDTLREHARLLRRPGVTLIAEKVETHDEFEFCKDAGYDWFQGYFFCRPKVVQHKALPTNRLSLLRLLARLLDPATELEDLGSIIEQDVALGYRLLRYVNCAVFALPHRIESIRQTLTLLGLNRVRSCVSLLLMTRIDDKPREFIEIALVRARMCQLLAGDANQARREMFFSVGLLSVLDALMDRAMPDLLESIPLGPEMTGALLERSGPAGAALRAAIACETGAFDELRELGCDPDALARSYVDAVVFAAEAAGALLGDV